MKEVDLYSTIYRLIPDRRETAARLVALLEGCNAVFTAYHEAVQGMSEKREAQEESKQ